MSLTPLQRRILDLSYHHKLSHIGSSLGCVGILDNVYRQRGHYDPVILSCGHAGLALYVILEAFLGRDAEALLLKHGVHPSKAPEDGIYCSTGSLGQGITIAVGRALANRSRRVHCVISDGESAEGAVYESLRFARRAELTNLKVHLHLNGYAAYRSVDIVYEWGLMKSLLPWMVIHTDSPVLTGEIPFLKGLDSHYTTMTEADWAWVQAQEVTL